MLLNVPKPRQHHLPSSVLRVITGRKQVQTMSARTPSKEACTSLMIPCLVNNSMKNLLIKCLTAYLKSSNLHVESVSIRNATTDVSLQNLKAKNCTLYKAPAILGSYYFMVDIYDFRDRDAMIIKAVSSGCAVLLMFLTAAIVYVLRKKLIVVREAREHNAERAFNWI
ncbi:hypothetical protein F2Q69_00039466 [Brassica cretica]|uniref:Uncharacterized protein n=1 Tax=Brassica cretica TaxID=69181 RepID=A0A8S9NP27_BRACR|nr:hypothetical protein F2Q69_00039466 [Brassica cretica]